MKPFKSLYAFTLVELAIVLIIIGLITGGVVGAQSLIESAKINSIISDYNNYKIATNSYYLDYGAIPGDDKSASEWFSGATDGNGDKQLCCVSSGVNEIIFFWDHLQRAELLLSGLNPVSTANPIPGDTIPKSNISEISGWWAFYTGVTGQEGWGFGSDAPYGYSKNVLSIGDTEGGTRVRSGVLNSKDTRKIDLKIDDGLADKGRFIAIRGIASNGSWESGCVDNPPSSASATYQLSNDNETCHPVFLLDL